MLTCLIYKILMQPLVATCISFFTYAIVRSCISFLNFLALSYLIDMFQIIKLKIYFI